MYYSRYYDNRVHPHYTRLYSKVPYLDTEIYNIDQHNLRESRRFIDQSERAHTGLARTLEKSLHLENNLARSRVERDRDDKEYIRDLELSKTRAIERSTDGWRDSFNKKNEKRLQEISEQRHLRDRLLENSRRAYSRLDTVRRWL